MTDRLLNKVAIVTGAGRGIGREVALWLAREGASVVVNDLGVAVDGTGESDAPADLVVKEIKAEGGNAIASFDSVADFDSASKIVKTAVENFGGVDILCHPAGILRDRMIFNMTEEEWDAVLQVHLYGAFNMVRNVVPHMIKQNYGRIVLFSSGSGLGASGQGNYAAAKEGMVGFTRAISKELEPYNIMVNAVYPGGSTRMTDTVPQSTTDLRQQQREAVGLDVQRDRSQPPEEYRDPANNAPKVVYLCTEAADGITGQVIGTSGWALSLYSPRHVIKSIHKNGKWTLDELDDLIPISLAEGLINPVPLDPPK
ncbi:MAG: 3-hydroxyacyl-CoA dehydrogenase [Chloroflexi bacterium]|nr:MAG: SDR family NAD(P)-dependent oxidoreductase [SAR202 cluster bacterium]MAO74877.1 3-hydroxyacyl-CoA dehydrogenase [Chloroflexota bacterium]|tara:strand:+ start:1809 stop:2747 length:939 start_codon:yes stop_codon:yes gene_type:complete